MWRSDRERARGLPLFRCVSPQCFDGLMKVTSMQRIAQHAVFIEEDRLPQFLYIVLEGTVELFSRTGERETTLDIVRPTTTFVLPAVIRNEPYLNSARAFAPLKILAIPAAAVRDAFNRDEQLARAVAIDLAVSHNATVRALKDLKLLNSAERLANWILEASHEQGNNGNITLCYAKRTLASRLGMTPENLSRNLASLAKHCISLKGRVMTITDIEALRQYAKPSPSINGNAHNGPSRDGPAGRHLESNLGQMARPRNSV